MGPTWNAGHILYVVYPDRGGSWRVQGVPPAPQSFELRLALPEAWRGLRNAELDQVTKRENEAPKSGRATNRWSHFFWRRTGERHRRLHLRPRGRFHRRPRRPPGRPASGPALHRIGVRPLITTIHESRTDPRSPASKPVTESTNDRSCRQK